MFPTPSGKMLYFERHFLNFPAQVLRFPSESVYTASRSFGIARKLLTEAQSLEEVCHANHIGPQAGRSLLIKS
jgi:hypothetical protein